MVLAVISVCLLPLMYLVEVSLPMIWLVFALLIASYTMAAWTNEEDD